MDILRKIDDIETAIFDYELENITGSVVDVFSRVVEINAIDTRDPQALNNLNSLMAKCLSAMRDKDYLLLADQLEYVLKPMITRE